MKFQAGVKAFEPASTYSGVSVIDEDAGCLRRDGIAPGMAEVLEDDQGTHRVGVTHEGA
jgi:hypothetical protein